MDIEFKFIDNLYLSPSELNKYILAFIEALTKIKQIPSGFYPLELTEDPEIKGRKYDD